MQNFELRPAIPEEAPLLSELTARSKAHWPYDQEYLDLATAAIAVSAGDIAKWPFVVATSGSRICGFACVMELKSTNERMLDSMWIEPEFIGRGIGRILFEASVREAAKLGWRDFKIISDPYAEEFYKRMGAKRIGERESQVRKGFFLPLLEYSIERT